MIPDRLKPVIDAKLVHVSERKALTPLATVEARARSAPPPRGFAATLRARVDAGRYALIAEIKRASPSRGLIRAEFDPTALARAYQAGGAACLSVLTDAPFFQGDDHDLVRAREAVSLPVLRKDFMVDPYQVAEARMLGADCILLIMAALDDGQAAELKNAAEELGMDVLVEVHDGPELQRALRLGATLIGINNRNLKTLEVDLATSINLARELPGNILPVGESGLATPDDLARLYLAGIGSFLVGESLLRHADVETATRALLVDRS